jgi:L-malate glycosyltransferase
MKISVLLEAFQPEYWGGRETRWDNVIGELSKRHQITVFADFSRTPSHVAFPIKGVECVHIGALPKMYTRSGSRSLLHAFVYSLKARKVIKRPSDVLLTDQTPLVFMPLIWVYSKINMSKFSVVWHEYWDYKTWSQYSKVLAPIGLLIQNYAFLFSENVVVPSDRVKSQIVHSWPKKRKSIKVIANGFQTISTEDLIPMNEIVTEFGKLDLLFVGRLIQHKNVEFLVSVMSEAKLQGLPWHLTVVGNGPLELELDCLVKSLGLESHITFKRNVDAMELNRIYSKSRVFVFPSEREGYGISVAEALMHNLPVVLFDVFSNASADLITDSKMGRKLGQLDVALWIDAISRLAQVKSPSISKRFQDSQKSWREVSDEYERFLESLM